MNLNDSVAGPSINRLLLKLVMNVVVASLFCPTPAGAQVAATTKKAESVKHRTILTICYAAGLRISEAAVLQVCSRGESLRR